MGAALPAGLMQPAEDNNEAGFWEPQSVAKLNDEILQALDSEWDDVFSFRPREYLSNFDGYYLGRAVELLKMEFSESELIVLKDPRISVLSAFWERALRRAGYATHYVVMVRNPLEVAESLRARDGFPREKSLLLWNSYMVAVDRDTRNRPRTFISFDELMSNWRSVRQRIEQSSRCPFPRDTAMASIEIDRYLSHRLRHHKAAADDLFSCADVPEQTKLLYQLFLSACRGGDVDSAAVDDIEAQLANIESIVGPLFADLKARGRILEKELGEARQQSEAAHERLRSLEGEIADERSRLSHALDEQKREHAELADSFRQDRDHAVKKAESLQRELLELATRLSAAEADRDRLAVDSTNERERHLAEIESLKALVEEAQRELAVAKVALENEKTSAAEALASAERREAELSAQLEKVGARHSDLEEQMEQRFREIAALTDELRQKHLEVTEAQQRAAAKEAEVCALAERTRSDRDKLEKEIERSRADYDALHRELKAAGAQREAMEGRLNERFNEIAILGRMLADQQTREQQSTENAEWLRQVSCILLDDARSWKATLRRLLPRSIQEKRRRKLLKRDGLFDGDAYLAVNSDVERENTDPLRHYLRHGMTEQRRRS
jgi:hypothetical protein